MRKLFLGLGGLLLVLVLLVLILPFLIDFNKFKPQIKAAVAENMQADLEFESARLTIFPHIGVRLINVVLENRDPQFSGTRTFVVGNLDFHAELMKLFAGEFVGYVQIDQPEIRFLQRADKNNLAALAKPKALGSEEQAPGAASPGATQTDAAAPSDPEKSKQMVEDFKNRVSIRSLRINDALVLFTKDDGTDVEVKKLNIHIDDIGLEREISTHIFTNLNADVPGTAVSGPIDLKFKNTIQMREGAFEQLNFSGKLDFSRLKINAAQGAFSKSEAIPLFLDFTGFARSDMLILKPMTFGLHNFTGQVAAEIRDFNALNTDLTFSLQSDEISSLADLLPKHKDLLHTGKLLVELEVKGKLSQYEKLGLKLRVDANLAGSDFSLRTTATSLMPPAATVSLGSQNIDLGALLKPFMPPQAETSPKEKVAESQPAAEPKQDEATPVVAPAEEFALSEDQKKMLAGSDLNVKIDLNKITYDELKLQSFGVDFHHRDLVAQLNHFQVAMFGGMVSSSGTLDLGKFPVHYAGKLSLKNIDISQLIEFIKPEHKQVMSGFVTLALDMESTGTTKDNMINSLNGNGQFQLHEGRFNSASIGQLVGQEVEKYTKDLQPTQTIDVAYQKIEKAVPKPLLEKLNLGKEKDRLTADWNRISSLPVADRLSRSRDLKDVKGEITIANGTIQFKSDYRDDSGLFQLDQGVKLDGTLSGQHLFVASDALKADLEKSTQYAALLYDDKKQFALPFSTSGTVTEPKVAVDFAAIGDRFKANAQKLIEAEFNKRIGGQKDQLLSAGREKLQQELNKQRDKAQAEVDKRKKEAQDKADQEKAKAQAKADQEKKKALDKTKEQMKGKVKIPGF